MKIAAGRVAAFAAAFVSAGAGLFVWAQEAPTIRVTTHLVLVNVIVRDKNGPVTNLKKEDFTLFEKGKERQITSFSMTADAPAAVVQAGMKMPSNIFSNRFDRSAATPNTMTVILIDAINTNLMDQQLVRKQTLELLSTLKPDDRVALYLLGNQVRVLHDFTSDFDGLRTAVQRAKGEYSGTLAVSDPLVSEISITGLDAAFQEQNDQIAVIAMEDRARRTTDALAGIARHISVIPGRKNLIWVSGSFPIGIGNDLELRSMANAMPSAGRFSTPATQLGGLPDVAAGPGFGGAQSQQMFTDHIQKAWRALNQANVAVYPVDARGLLAADLGLAPGTKPNFRLQLTGIDTMGVLADRTGGKAYRNTSDLAGAMRQAIDDGKVTYTIGFNPHSNELDGKFHDLKVKVARSGVDVRHRTGFVALDDAPRTEKQIEEDLRTAATRPLDITEIGVSARADIVAPAPAQTAPEPKASTLSVVPAGPVLTPGATMRVAVSIDLSDVRVDKRGDRWVGRLELFVFQVGASGEKLDGTSASIPLNLTEENYRNAVREGMVISKTFQTFAAAKMIRVLVLDRVSGKIGSLRMPMGPIMAASQKQAGGK